MKSTKTLIVKAKFQEIVADTPQFASDLLLREWSRSRNCCEICDEESEKEREGLVLCPRCALYNGWETTVSVSSGGGPYPYSDMRLVLQILCRYRAGGRSLCVDEKVLDGLFVWVRRPL